LPRQTIHSVAEEVRSLDAGVGGPDGTSGVRQDLEALLQRNVWTVRSVGTSSQSNAGALWWERLIETPPPNATTCCGR